MKLSNDNSLNSQKIKGGYCMELQEKVREYLDVNGVKKNKLSTLLGIYPTQLYKWLLGEYELSDNQNSIIKKFIDGGYNIPVPLNEDVN